MKKQTEFEIRKKLREQAYTDKTIENILKWYGFGIAEKQKRKRGIR